MGGYWRLFFQGPVEVIAKLSPNGEYKAFVSNAPSVNGPNQGLYIETADREEYLKIANLEEDVDFIKDIIWEDNSQAVLFWSKDYLTLVRIEDFYTVRIYLSKAWIRQDDNRQSKFITQDSKDVEWVKFEDQTLKYKFRESDQIHSQDFLNNS